MQSYSGNSPIAKIQSSQLRPTGPLKTRGDSPAGEIAMAEPCAGTSLLRLWGCGCAFSEVVVQFANKKPGDQAGVKK